MSRNNSSNESRSDEIDLFDLFRRIGQTISGWFKALGRGFLVTFAFLIRNILPIILSLILGAGISLLVKWVARPVYVSDITLRSNAVQNADMIDYFNKLSIGIKEDNFAGIAASLSLSPEKAAQIIEIKPYWVISKNKDNVPDYVDYKNKFDVRDTLNQRMQDRFVIEAKVANPVILSELAKGFILYVRNNPAFMQKNAFRLKENDELITRLKYDIKQLDSLQKVKYFEETRNKLPEKGGQIVFLQEQKTQLVYEDIYSLYQKKQSLDQEKELYSDLLTVLSDFYTPLKRYNGGFYYGKFIIPSAFALMIIYLLMSLNRKKLKEFYKKY